MSWIEGNHNMMKIKWCNSYKP